MFIGDQATGVGSRLKRHLKYDGKWEGAVTILQMKITHRQHVYFVTPSSLILPIINKSKARLLNPKTKVFSLLQPPNVPSYQPAEPFSQETECLRSPFISLILLQYFLGKRFLLPPTSSTFLDERDARAVSVRERSFLLICYLFCDAKIQNPQDFECFECLS
jgi:hypothetical protein